MAAGIGEAIGLQDKPNLFAGQAAGALARLSAEESAREAARRKAQEKDEADTKKVISDADIYSKNTTWHKMYAPAAYRELRDFANDMINYKVENPNASGTGAYQTMKLQELHGRMNRLKQNNDAFKDFEKGVQEGKYYADPNLFKKLYETDFAKKLYRDENGRVVSGDWGALKTDERYGAMIDANGDFISNPVKKFDFQNKIGGFMNNSNVWTEKELKTRSQKGVPGMYEDISVKEVDPLQRESFVDEMVSNPDAVRAWQIENKDRIDSELAKNPALKDPRNYSQFVQETMAEDVRLKTSGRKEDRVGRHIAPPKPPKAAKPKGPSLDASFDELKDTITETDTFSAPMGKQVAEKEGLEKLRQQVKKDEIDAKEYTLSEADKKVAADRKKQLEEKEKAYGKEGATDVKYSYPTTLKTANQPTVVNLGPDVIDLKTNTAPTESNQLKFIPRKIGMLKVKGKWGAYVFGESYDKAAATDSDGNVKTDQTTSGDFAIPLSKVEAFLNQQGTPTKWTSEALQKLKGGSAKAISVQPSQPTTSSNSQANVNSGNNAPDQYISSILDFENSKGYKNFGFTSHNGTLNKSQATEKFKKEYLPMIAELPIPLQAVAGDFAFNSEDPRASLLVAAGNITPEQKKKLYVNGKLDKAKVDDLWNNGENDVIALFNYNSKDFLDEFDKERLRSYKGTNGADKKYSEWAERVKVSRKVADKLLGGTAEKKKPDNTGKPKQVKQNGVVYILNEETGEYE